MTWLKQPINIVIAILVVLWVVVGIKMAIRSCSMHSHTGVVTVYVQTPERSSIYIYPTGDSLIPITSTSPAWCDVRLQDDWCCQFHGSCQDVIDGRSYDFNSCKPCD